MDIGVELPANLRELAQVVGRVTVAFGRQVKAAAQLGDDLALVGLVAVTGQDEIAEAALAQPPVDHVQRGRLLANEQYRLAGGQTFGNDVGDGSAGYCRWPRL